MVENALHTPHASKYLSGPLSKYRWSFCAAQKLPACNEFMLLACQNRWLTKRQHLGQLRISFKTIKPLCELLSCFMFVCLFWRFPFWMPLQPTCWTAMAHLLWARRLWSTIASQTADASRRKAAPFCLPDTFGWKAWPACVCVCVIMWCGWTKGCLACVPAWT